MRVLKIALIALFTSGIFVACKKEKTEKPENPAQSIEGTWVGKYGFGNDAPSIYFSLKFKSGGVIEEIGSSGEVKGTGTWEMTGNTITAHYSYVSNQNSFSLVAAFDASTGKLLGNWGYGSSATDGGLWEMTKP